MTRCTTFQEQLKQLNACAEATDWVGSKSLSQAWKECPRGDWLLWLAGEVNVDRRLIVEAACRCAESVIGLVPAGEDRPIRAIEAARAWIVGEATLDEVRAAAGAAYAAAARAAAWTFYAAWAARAAARAAAYAAAGADAAGAADAAARAPESEAQQACADLVRQVITVADIEKATGATANG